MALLTERTRLQLDALQALVEARGPWVSMYVGLADRDPQGHAAERTVRWHGLATALLDEETPGAVVAGIGDAVQTEPHGPAVLAAFAAEEAWGAA